MAEIRIERKKPVWPWIVVLLLVLGAVIWFLVDRGEIQVQEDGQVRVPAVEQRTDREHIDTLR